jgi:ribose-phosphate pyrophosphokinase
MIIYYTRSTEYLAQQIALPQAPRIIKEFSDGELYVKTEQEVQAEETVWILASTEPPATNLVELFLLLDALTHQGTQNIHLFFSYFGYARQSIAQPGEAHSTELICNILRTFPISKTFIVHAHAAPILQTYLPFTNVIDLNFFCSIAKAYDVIAAPDKGAAPFAKEVAHACNKDMIFLQKRRPAHDQVTIESVDGAVTGKKVLLVDDIISTGRTLVEAAQALVGLGATEVSAAATHGIFAPGSVERLTASPLTHIHVTNTPQRVAQGKIQVYDESSFIESVIRKS